MYRVSELFRTVQGEGTYTGTPAAFIRLYGCGVACPWCDTAYAWRGTPQAVAFDNLLYAQPEAPLVAEATPDQLAAWVDAQHTHHIVITGGEPFEQDLGPLLSALSGFIQVETSGTASPTDSALGRIDWVTVSPKVGMPGGLAVLPDMLDHASEIKMPVGRQRDIDNLLGLLAQLTDPPPVYLQPLSQSPTATRLCIDAAAAHGWRVSLQTHKFAGLR